MDQVETVSLKEFFDVRLKAQDEQIRIRFDALDMALNLAREDAKDKYEHLNALRTEVTTDRGLLVQITACGRQHKELGVWIDSVNSKLTVLETRSITWTAAVGVFFLLVSIGMRVFGK